MPRSTSIANATAVPRANWAMKQPNTPTNKTVTNWARTRRNTPPNNTVTNCAITRLLPPLKENGYQLGNNLTQYPPPPPNKTKHPWGTRSHLLGEMQPRASDTPRALARASPGASPPYPLAFTIRRVVTASSPVSFSPVPALGSPSSGPKTLLFLSRPPSSCTQKKTHTHARTQAFSFSHMVVALENIYSVYEV